MREIDLTQGKIAFVDDEDYDRINQFKWYAHYHKKRWYAIHNLPRQKGKIRKQMGMHNAVIGTLPGLETDHIDGNGLNNQKRNLRFVSTRQNQQNQHVKKSSHFPGVSWYNASERWRATIYLNGKQKYLGQFTDELEAATAYRVACEVLTGQRVI